MLRFDGGGSSHDQPSNSVTLASNSAVVVEAMQLFDQLIHNKTFMLTFMQVCESPSNSGSFTLKDKCHFASLVTLGLKDNLPYLYSIIKCLLSDYIASCFQATNQTKVMTNSNAAYEFGIRHSAMLIQCIKLINSLKIRYLKCFWVQVNKPFS